MTARRATCVGRDGEGEREAVRREGPDVGADCEATNVSAMCCRLEGGAGSAGRESPGKSASCGGRIEAAEDEEKVGVGDGAPSGSLGQVAIVGGSKWRCSKVGGRWAHAVDCTARFVT